MGVSFLLRKRILRQVELKHYRRAGLKKNLPISLLQKI